jgi:hypothetical protein
MHVPHSVHLPVQVVDPSGARNGGMSDREGAIDKALSSDQVFLLVYNVGVAVEFCVVGAGGRLCVCV